MKYTRSNIILIDMPGAGKSTIGVILAKLTSRNFVDTDVLIQTSQNQTLQDIVDTEGYEVLRTIEEDVLLGLSVRNCVVATGGSAVYSDRALAHLKSDGLVIFLDVDLPTLEWRVKDIRTRGLAKRADQSFSEMFHERMALYSKHADISVECSGLTHEEVCARIIERMREKTGGQD
jgi:shikimate kinase